MRNPQNSIDKNLGPYITQRASNATGTETENSWPGGGDWLGCDRAVACNGAWKSEVRNLQRQDLKLQN